MCICIQWLLQTLTKDSPAGFCSVKIDQVLRADKELWTIRRNRCPLRVTTLLTLPSTQRQPSAPKKPEKA